jgi:hypothetical protein
MRVRMSVAALFVAVFVFAVAAVAAPPESGKKAREGKKGSEIKPFITGRFTDMDGGQGAFTGNLRLAPFAVENGALVAVGTLVGTLMDSTGKMLGKVRQRVTWPVGGLQATCEDLHLELAPPDLEGLDVQVHVDPVVLDLGARRPGGVPRDLLCSVAEALEGQAKSSDVAPKLNDVFRSLR